VDFEVKQMGTQQPLAKFRAGSVYDGDKRVLIESLHRIHATATEILSSIGVIETRKKRSEEERPVVMKAAA
jgi:hypothetical protein